MIISVDAMGGDFAPKETVMGACKALRNSSNIEKMYLVGDKSQIESLIDEDLKDRIEIIHTDTIIGMDEHPAQAYRSKRNASICIASRLVKEGRADAVVSAGSTGAQLVAGLFEIGRIKGIKRPAIAVQLPSVTGPKILIDAGANTDVDSLNLLQFAIMGKSFAEVLLNKSNNVKVGLLNNGSEETKGNTLTQESFSLLKNNTNIDFYGNIEGNEVLTAPIDVIVCDGFTGNILLKTMEGMGKTIFSTLKEEINSSLMYKIGALLLKPCLINFKKNFDSKEVGGSPLLGLNGASIVCHGNSDARAFANGIRMAENCVKTNLVEKIKHNIMEDSV